MLLLRKNNPLFCLLHFCHQTVCEATQCQGTKVRMVALQCLVRIMSLYYHHMHLYMGPALFGITVDAMKSSEDDIALQGIEFWSTVAEEEIDLALDAQDAQESNREVAHPSHLFAKGWELLHSCSMFACC